MSDLSRRDVLGLLAAASMVGPAQSATRDTLEVSLTLTDEAGQALPFATVWACVLPRANAVAIDGQDLWRATLRYADSFEFATAFNVPLRTLLVLPMADGKGRLRYTLDYQDLEGISKHRPPQMQVGFSVMKRGYRPARVDFEVTGQERIDARVVLQREPAAAPAGTYLQEFERLRYELSDSSSNARISQSVHERQENLRAALESAAAAARQSNDLAAGARIYARMQHLPLTLFDQHGRPIGFAQTDPYSERSLGYLTQAYELDPSNPYVASRCLFRRGAAEFGGNSYIPERAPAERRQAFAQFLEQLHALMQESGDAIWPEYHFLYALWHRKSSDPAERAKATELVRRLYEFEPKYDTLERMLMLLR